MKRHRAFFAAEAVAAIMLALTFSFLALSAVSSSIKLSSFCREKALEAISFEDETRLSRFTESSVAAEAEKNEAEKNEGERLQN